MVDGSGRGMSVRASRAAVLSVARKYDVPELLVKLDDATEEMELNASRDVVVTGTGMKDASTQGEFVEGAGAEYLVDLYTRALKVRRRFDAGQRAQMGAGGVDFSRRFWGG